MYRMYIDLLIYMQFAQNSNILAGLAEISEVQKFL